jgi:hypothetical protein
MTLKKATLYLGALCIAAYFLLGCEQAAGPAAKTGEGFTVTVAPNLSHGTITVEPPKAAEGTEITLTVTPQEDYYLEEGYPVLMDTDGGGASLIDGDPEALVFVFPMPAHDVLVSASFAQISNGVYSITIDPSVTNGTVTASAAESKERKTITVILAPDPQMQFHSGSLKVNNGEVKVSGSKTRYTFAMPAKDVVISAEFKPPNNINTAEEFRQIGRTEDFPLDEIYEINADITLSDWTPPDSEKSPFTGVIYGQGKTITLEGFSSSALSDAKYLGIFACLRSAVVQDLTITGASAPFSATSAQYCGLLAGYAERAELKNIAVAGTLDATRTSGYMYLGGAAGYMDGGSLENDPSCEISSVSVTGKATGGAVYGGGMVGYAKNVTTISGVHTTGDVTVTGEGHNTSAGGFSAYSYASKIFGCSATGDISVVADSHGAKDDSHLYMTYAGGLVGQSVSLGATITKSYATGTAYAKSPYPYAGGLCGYNYGDSVIAECYATGTVSAESQGALPYAGGLSGYNSNKAVIQDSYATGYVSAFFSSTGSAGWTGGIVGSNAKDAVISRCYSLSAVSPPAFMGGDGMPMDQPGVTPGGVAGGIAGHTYFTQYANAPLTKIENCAALNSSLRGNKVHRITGSVADNPILSNNIGWADMDWTPGPEAAERTANGLDGADCVAQPGQSVFTDTLGWDFASVWEMGGNGYPVLQWQ